MLQIPHIRAPVRKLITKDLPHCHPHAVIPSCPHNCTGGRSSPILQTRLPTSESADPFRDMLYLDLAVEHELAASDIDVVFATAGKVCAGYTSPIGTEVKLEAGVAESV